MHNIRMILLAITLVLGTTATANAVTQREKCTVYISMMDTFLHVAKASIDAGIDVYSSAQIKALSKFPPAARATLTKREYSTCIAIYKQFSGVLSASDRRTLKTMEQDNFAVSN